MYDKKIIEMTNTFRPVYKRYNSGAEPSFLEETIDLLTANGRQKYFMDVRSFVTAPPLFLELMNFILRTNPESRFVLSQAHLEKLNQRMTKPETAPAAYRTAQWLQSYFPREQVVCYKEEKNFSLDEIVRQQSNRIPCTVITWDAELAKNMNDLRYFLGRNVTVLLPKKDGLVRLNHAIHEPAEPQHTLPTPPVPSTGEMTGHPQPPYTTASGETVELEGEGAHGAEGTVYQRKGDPTEMVKLFHYPLLADSEGAKKIAALAALNSRAEGLCFPRAVVLDSADNTAGFVMHRAKGIPLTTLLADNSLLEQLTRPQLYELCESLVVNVLRLARNGILPFDLAPKNLFVDLDNCKMTLIDLDSVQYLDYASLTGSPETSPPWQMEQAVEYGKAWRHLPDLCYSLLVIVFQIIHNGLHPYGNSSNLEAVRNRSFVFSWDSMEEDLEKY